MDDPVALGRPVAVYKEASSERTCERKPMRWAMMLVNLGVARRKLAERTQGRNRGHSNLPAKLLRRSERFLAVVKSPFIVLALKRSGRIYRGRFAMCLYAQVKGSQGFECMLSWTLL